MRRSILFRILLSGLLVMAVLSLSAPANAYSGGISGFSGKNGPTCTQCHSTGTSPTVTLTGPTSVASGSTNSYTLTVTGTGNGGLDVAATAGTFTAGTGTQVMGGEITQSSPSSSHSWMFSWTAPTVTSTTTETVYAAAIDGKNGGTGTVIMNATVTASSNPSITLSPTSLNFSYTIGGSTPGAQSIGVTSSGTALSYTIAAAGGSWLSASGGGNTPGNISASVNPANLTAGTYNGTVTVTASGASNSPQTVPVVLTVTSTSGATLQISPSFLDFNFTIGGSNPNAQSITVNSSGTALNFTAASSGGSWLSASGSGTTPGKFSASVNPAGLSAGTYKGTVTITSPGASNSPQTVPVILIVGSSSSGTIAVHPARLVFYAESGDPAPQTITVNSSGSPLSFTTEAFGGSWVAVTPSGGTTPGHVSVSAYTAGLPPGTYSCVVQIKGGTSTRNVEVVLVLGGRQGTNNAEDSQLQPFMFDPGARNSVGAGLQSGAGITTHGSTGKLSQSLKLTKDISGPPTALAGAMINGAAGSTISQLAYDLQAGSECSASAPQFVIVTNDNVVHHAGCSHGIVKNAATAGWKRVSFDPDDASQVTPAIPPGTVVQTVALVMDEVASNGTAVLANIALNDTSNETSEDRD